LLGKFSFPGGSACALWNLFVRLRAAALGFVVMESRESVVRILEAGPEHEVNGVFVRVYPFHKQDTAEQEVAGPSLVSVPQDTDEESEFSTNLGEESWCSSPSGIVPMIAAGTNFKYNAFRAFTYASEQELQNAMPTHYED